MTDSMAYCDVVLPAATHFEYHDLYAAYGTHWLQRAEPVIRPRGESQPNTEIFRRLAARFGFTDPAFTASDAELMDDAIDASDPRLGGVRPSALPTDRALAMTVGGEDAVMFANVFPKTASGKIELASSYLDQKYDQRLPSYRPYETPYPLLLISPASDRRITSTFGNVPRRRCAAARDAPGRRAGAGPRARHADQDVERAGRGPPAAGHHRRGAAGRGVLAQRRVVQDERQRPDGLRARPGHHADLAGGACYNDARVEVAAYASL